MCRSPNKHPLEISAVNGALPTDRIRTMHPALSKNYIVPGLLLNPILFLWSVNTILSRLLPPIVVNAAVQPPPFYPLGPSAEHPHLDIHSSERICWSYTAFIVCANLAAFERVNGRRQEAKERVRLRKERARKTFIEAKLLNGDGKDVNGALILVNGAMKHEEQEDSAASQSGQAQWHTEGSDTERSNSANSETTDSETIL